MEITKLDGLNVKLRGKLAEGTIGEDTFVMSILADGTGILVEFDKDVYILTTEELIKEFARQIKGS